jgi:hypothetical protein
MQTRRVSGKMHSEHIASLGSVDAEVSVRERLAFWAKLPERLARLGNRVGPNDQAKVYAARHARIPMVTPDEQRAIQEANAEGDERFWDAMHDMGTASVDECRALISRAETTIAEHAPKAAEAGERAQAAKDRLERIRRGESVPGGLGKPFDVRAALKAEGFTERDLRRMRLLSALRFQRGSCRPRKPASRVFAGISGRLASSSGAMARVTRPHSCPTTCWRCGSETKRERHAESAQATQTWGVLHWPSQSARRHPIRASEQ